MAQFDQWYRNKRHHMMIAAEAYSSPFPSLWARATERYYCLHKISESLCCSKSRIEYEKLIDVIRFDKDVNESMFALQLRVYKWTNKQRIRPLLLYVFHRTKTITCYCHRRLCHPPSPSLPEQQQRELPHRCGWTDRLFTLIMKYWAFLYYC